MKFAFHIDEKIAKGDQAGEPRRERARDHAVSSDLLVAEGSSASFN